MIINYGFKKMNLRRITSTTISKEMDDLVCKLLKFKKEGIMKKKCLKITNITIYIFQVCSNKIIF